MRRHVGLLHGLNVAEADNLADWEWELLEGFEDSPNPKHRLGKRTYYGAIKPRYFIEVKVGGKWDRLDQGAANFQTAMSWVDRETQTRAVSDYRIIQNY